MTVLVVVVLLVVGALVLLWSRAGQRPADQVDAFAAARSLTNRWSTDPGSSPGPVRDYIAQQSRGDED